MTVLTRSTRRAITAGFTAAIAAGTMAGSAMAADTLQEAESMEYGVVDRDGTTWPRAELDAAASGGKLLHYGPNGTAG